MSPSFLAIVAFGAVTSCAGAAMLLARDMGVWAGSWRRKSATFRLNRLPLARHDRVPRTLLGRFDYWFNRLVLETGSAWSPVTAALFLLLPGLLIGGALFLWNDSLMLLSIGMIVGMGLGLLVLIVERSRRIRLLQQQLPPALETLARAIRAGESLDQAVKLIGEKSPEPLAVEFRRCAMQLDMGLSLAAAMRALVHRVRLTDVRIFTTTLTVHRRTGGNLAHTLERLAAVIRERLNYRRHMRVATSAGRLSASMIASIGPLLFMYMFFVQPDYVRGLTETSIGQALLAIAVFLEIVGLIWITRLMRTD